MINEISINDLAEVLQKDAEWMKENYNDLLQKYLGQIIGIAQGKVLAVGEYEIEQYYLEYGKIDEKSLLILNIPTPDEILPFLI